MLVRKLVCKFVSLFCNDDVLHFNLEKRFFKNSNWQTYDCAAAPRAFSPSNRAFIQCSRQTSASCEAWVLKHSVGDCFYGVDRLKGGTKMSMTEKIESKTWAKVQNQTGGVSAVLLSGCRLKLDFYKTHQLSAIDQCWEDVCRKGIQSVKFLGVLQSSFG